MILQLPLLVLLLAIVQTSDAAKSNSSPVVKKVLIVGTGPAGLLAAHCLLSRNSSTVSYQVHIIDARSEPAEEGIGPRAHILGISTRGQNALNHFDTSTRSRGLLNHVKALSVATDNAYIHADSKKIPMRRGDGKRPPSLFLPRNRFCQGLLASLREVYGKQKNRLKISYRTPLKALDLNARMAFFENGGTDTYDLIIGADGVRSVVRKALLDVHASSSSPSPYKCVDEALAGGFKAMRLPAMPAAFEPDAIHLMTSTKTPVRVFVIPGADKKCYVGIGLRTNDLPSFLLPDTPIESIQQEIDTMFPALAPLSKEAAQQLKQQHVTQSRAVRLNSYTDTERRVLLIGDSAHATGILRRSVFSLL